MEKETAHWITIDEYEKALETKGNEGETACGVKIKSGMRFSTLGNIPAGYVNCEECKKKWTDLALKINAFIP